VNTFPGMAINISTWRPKLSTVTGGMSGACIKPLALRCVWDVYRNVSVPIIGGGGIMTAEDAVEFFLAGATAISIGTASFIDPGAAVTISQGIKDYLASMKIRSVQDLVGKIRVA
jgi:dihydroorotate dehydrogenase (NAD+) catalytic subunit